jgi:hypothetical protein
VIGASSSIWWCSAGEIPDSPFKGTRERDGG